MPQAEGTSNKGDFQQALRAAISSAMKAEPGSDRLVSWRLQEVNGQEGSIAGISTCVVKISYTD